MLSPIDFSIHTEALSPKLHEICRKATKKYPPEYFAEKIVNKIGKVKLSNYNETPIIT